VILSVLVISANAFGHDTDLYMASGEGVEPNILIIFDNSNSTADEIKAYFYNPATTYSGSKSAGAVY
jgi:hypothetical protein